MNAETRTAGQTATAGETATGNKAKAKKLTALEAVQLRGRRRAYYNRNEGGIILTSELTGNDYNGVHWRALLDGGNRYDGRYHWVAGRACGGGYNVRACALAEAICGIIGPEIEGAGYDFIGWHNPREWAGRAKAHGWTLFIYGDEMAVVLIPSDEVAAKIKAEIEAERVNA